MKAFLSHSSRDKEFVEAVAQELGRQFCVFDKHAFESGQDLVQSIEEGLADSHVFVLIASAHALKSNWVELESNEAAYRKVMKHIQSALVLVVDSTVALDDLPAWLRRALVTRVAAPKIAARLIRRRLDDLLREHQRPVFVGRADLLQHAERALVPAGAEPGPRVFGAYGLNGIGRRTIAQRLATSLFNFASALVVAVESGETIHDLAIKLADRVEPYSTREGFERLVREIRALDGAAALARALSGLRVVVSNREMPTLVDLGGMLDENARFVAFMRDLLQGIQGDPDLYAALVLRRKPDPESLPEGTPIALLRVEALTNEEVQRLVRLVAARESVQLTETDAKTVARYVAGYPPAAYYAVGLIRDYGIALVLADERRLSDFRASTFARYLSEGVRLTREQRELMGLLSVYSPLPLPVIGRVVRLEASGLADALKYLIDNALVVLESDGMYALAPPIVEAARSAFGDGKVLHATVAAQVKDYLDTEDQDTRRLDLSRVLYRALILSGRRENSGDVVHLISDLIRLVEELYHEREYARAIEVGYEALRCAPKNVDAKAYLIRALVKEERFQDAETQIQEMRGFGVLKEAAFLSGFMNRHRERHSAAVADYEDAIRRGMKGVSIHRELAQCCMEIGDLDKAKEHVDRASQAGSENRYLLDLQVKIAIRMKDEAGARRALDRLEVVDSVAFFKHRKSTVEFAFGDVRAAHLSAVAAVGAARHPDFAMISQLVKCELALRRLDEAEVHLRNLDQFFPRTRKDIRTGLHCRLEIARSRYRNALGLTEQLGARDKPVHKALRRDALKGVLDHDALDDAIRARYKTEYDQLSAEITEGIEMYEVE